MFDDDKTQVLTEGTEDYPLDATLAANPEPCPNCQTEIAAANQFCSKCGYQRGTWGGSENADDQQASTEEVAAPALYYLVNEESRVGSPEGESIVGRGNVDLKLNDGYLSRQHAKFVASPETLELTDLGSANGSFVDDDKLAANEPVELSVGQSVKLGQTCFEIEKAEPTPVDEQPTEIIESSEEVASPEQSDSSETVSPADQNTDSLSPWSFEHNDGEIIHFELGETTIGRSATKSDAVISGDGFISSLHVKVTASQECLEAEDLGSTNGTKHNGEKLQANTPVELTAGDTLQVGETVCLVAQSVSSNEADETESEEIENEKADPADKTNS